MRKGLDKSLGKASGLVVHAPHLTNVRRLVRIEREGFEGRKKFLHPRIGQLLVALTGQPRHHFASRVSALRWHQHLLVPSKMPLEGAETVDVLHALEKLFIEVHGGLRNPCFFNAPLC